MRLLRMRFAARAVPLGRSRGWTQKSLVIAQAALSLVLLSAAGLLTQSLYNMQRQNFGFETPNRYIRAHRSANGRIQAASKCRHSFANFTIRLQRFRASAR